MPQEIDEINKHIAELARYARNHFKSRSIAELEQDIEQFEYHLASMQDKNPADPRLVGMRDLLLLMQLARGKGGVM